MALDYEIRIKDVGPREALLIALQRTLDTLDIPIKIDEVRDEGDELVVDFDIDVENLLLWAFQAHPRGKRFVPMMRVLKKAKRARSGGKFKADDPKTPENEAWEVPPKKKAAPKKRAAPKKAVAKKKKVTKKK
tara:strand:+ start:378 stop:776 length:399 start_codon:yes stop_codon:yes gene_type:complete